MTEHLRHGLAMTRDEYIAAMQGRDRPLGSTMSNAAASKARAEAAVFYASPIEAVLADRAAGRLRPVADPLGRLAEPLPKPGPVAEPRPKPAHGTNSGYVTHVKRGEKACPECNDAHNAYMADYKTARKRKQAAA